MPGATVSLDGDNSKFNRKADESRKKVEDIASKGGKAIEESFDKGTFALGKMLVAAYAVKKIQDGILSVTQRINNDIISGSEKYSGGKLRAEIAGGKAGLSSQFVDSYLKGKGKTSYEERIGAIESFGSDPLSKYLKKENVEAALKLHKTGLASQEEVSLAARMGPEYIQKLVDKRKAGLSPTALAEYNAQSEISEVGARPTAFGQTGRDIRVQEAYADYAKRRDPQNKEIAGTISEQQTNEAYYKEGGKYMEIQRAMDKALEKNRQAETKPNYTPGH